MARQKLGQHFLNDQSVLERITKYACDKGAPLVTEIGPGKGALTEHLLRRAAKVTAIEIDSDLVIYLRHQFPKLNLIHADALKADLGDTGPLTGNLPYSVATPLISRVLRLRRPATFLIQKEVAERITAKPCTRDYGYFSIECQLFSVAEYLFTVRPGSFRPPPKVDSAVIQLTPRESLEVQDPEPFLSFVSRCFHHKRKTLRNNLADLMPASEPEANLRAEQLTLPQFADLYRRLSSRDQSADPIEVPSEIVP